MAFPGSSIKMLQDSARLLLGIATQFLPRVTVAYREALPPYRTRKSNLPGIILIAIILFTSILYGMVFAVFSGIALLPLVVPLIVTGLIVIWALPESTSAPTSMLRWMFFTFVLITALWPNYLAISLPGLPWITLVRLIGIPMLACFLVSYSISAPFRDDISAGMRSSPLLFYAISAFALCQMVSIVYSVQRASSINVFFNMIVSWYGLFIISFYAFYKAKKLSLLPELFLLMALSLCVLGLWENHLQKLPWVGHIPSFLSINDPIVTDILAGTMRGEGRGHRVQGPFTTALGLSEFLALCMPFLFSIVLAPGKTWKRALGLIAIPMAVYVTVLTQSRTGLLGVLITFLIYPFGFLWINHRENKGSVIATGALLLSPLVPIAGLAVALTIPGIRIRLLGGGVERYSTQGRIDQWHMGIPKILSHPWGYGVGQAAPVLGYTNAAGFLTIDSYPLRLVLDNGIQGIVAYYIVPIVSIMYLTRHLFNPSRERRQAQLYLAVAVVVVAFVAMQINFAQQDNEPIMFMVYGFLAAMLARSEPSSRSVRGGTRTPVEVVPTAKFS